MKHTLLLSIILLSIIYTSAYGQTTKTVVPVFQDTVIKNGRLITLSAAGYSFPEEIKNYVTTHPDSAFDVVWLSSVQHWNRMGRVELYLRYDSHTHSYTAFTQETYGERNEVFWGIVFEMSMLLLIPYMFVRSWKNGKLVGWKGGATFVSVLVVILACMILFLMPTSNDRGIIVFLSLVCITLGSAIGMVYNGVINIRNARKATAEAK